MKQFLLVVVMIAMSCASFAQGSQRLNQKMVRQKYVLGVPTTTNVNDTTVNTDTSNIYIAAALGWNISLQFTATNVTGTTGATVIYQGSNDNINWYTIMTDTATCNSCLATVTVSGLTGGATTVKSAMFRIFQFNYLRARYITSGTQTSYINGLCTYFSAYVTNLN